MSDLYLDSRKTALIAIDLQNAIMGIHTAPYPATEVVQRNRRIADQLRARGGLVVWVRVNLKQGLGLGFVVVEDACSGQDAEEHRFAFERIFPRLARVRTAEEVLNALA
jgi:nicotinamidase-related amidase